MPSRSAKQHRLMAMVATNPAAAKRLGIAQSVGEDFMHADKGRKFSIGGIPRIEVHSRAVRPGPVVPKFAKGGNVKKSSFPPARKGAMPAAAPAGMPPAAGGGMPFKKGGSAKCMARGGGVEVKGKTRGKVV